jgi:hypothetical protein
MGCCPFFKKPKAINPEHLEQSNITINPLNESTLPPYDLDEKLPEIVYT